MNIISKILDSIGLSCSKYKQRIEELEKENDRLLKSLKESRDSDYYLKVAVQSNLDAIICVNGEGKIVLFNPAAQELFQYSEQEVINQPVEMLISDGAKNKHEFHKKNYLKEGIGRCGHINKRTEKKFQKKDGTVFLAEHSLAGARANDKMYLASTIRDLTPTKEKDIALRESEERLKLALESANIGLWDHNLKTDEVYRSPQWAEMLGFHADEIQGLARTWKSLIHPDDRELVEKEAEAHEKNNTGEFRVEHRLRTKSGRYKWVLNWGKIVEFDIDGHPIRAVGTHIDIDDRKRAEESLKRIYDQFVSVLESLEAYIYVVDIESKKILFMNNKAKELHGDRKGEVCWNVIHKPSGDECEFCTDHKILDNEGKPSGIYKWELEDEESGKWYDIIDKPIVWTNGKVVKLEIAHDITDIKNTQHELEEVIATKDRLFSIIGHDLKNPLSDIIGFSELLYRNYGNYDRKKIFQFNELIYNSAKRTNELLNNLLEWSRFHSGKLAFKPEKFDLKEVVQKNTEYFKTKAAKKHIQLLNGIQQPVFVLADKKMIDTIIRNLISNAIKYTSKEGCVSVDCEWSEDKVIVIISDDGKGMTEEEINKLFKSEIDMTTKGTAGEQGTGLGLLICKDFIEKHDESIWAESEPGQGSEFKFTIKRKQ